MHQYLNIISMGPLVIARVPLKGSPGRRKHTMPWRELLKAAGAIMTEHGLKKRDISAIENLVSPDEWDPGPEELWGSEAERRKAAELYERIEAAFSGTEPERFERFWLYDWADGSFKLVRKPTKS